MPGELAAKDSAALVRAFQLSVVPFFGSCDGFYHITHGCTGACGVGGVVQHCCCQACLDFFFPLLTEC